jgi:hypothetical protein
MREFGNTTRGMATAGSVFEVRTVPGRWCVVGS